MQEIPIGNDSAQSAFAIHNRKSPDPFLSHQIQSLLQRCFWQCRNNRLCHSLAYLHLRFSFQRTEICAFTVGAQMVRYCLRDGFLDLFLWNYSPAESA